MTSDEIKRVREAAERYSKANELVDVLSASNIIRDFALSIVGTDGEKFPDLDWLKQEWGAWRHMQPASSFNHTIGEGDCVVVFWFDFDKSKIKWSIKINDEAIWLPPITTRYQFRLLAAALGIKRKGE